MTEGVEPADEIESADPKERERIRRRRLAEVFGDGPPAQTRDDLPDPGEADASRDEWLRGQVPPHHG